MTIVLKFDDLSAPTFFDLVVRQAERMDQEYGDTIDICVWWPDDFQEIATSEPEVERLRDGRWKFGLVCNVRHPCQKPEEQRLGSGWLPMEARTKDPYIHDRRIVVIIDYDPSPEYPMVLPYVLELFELVEVESGSLYEQLVSQSDEFAALIEDRPWDLMKNAEHRRMVELWWAGETQAFIGEELKLAEDTVNSYLSKLRTEYGRNIVPLDTDLKAMGKK